MSTDDGSNFIDGDVSARVGNGRKSGSVTIWLNTDGRIVEGDAGGRGNVWGRNWSGGRGGATVERTRGQTKATRRDVEVGQGLGRGCREIQGTGNGSGNVFCADGMTAVQGDRNGQCRRGWAERTAKEREQMRGHDEMGTSGCGDGDGGGHRM
jgi:hypothetical protein